MDNREIAKYNCFVSICSFGDAHTYKFPPAGFAGGLFTQMKGVVARLDELGGDKVSASGSSRQTTVSKAVARSRLTETLGKMNLAANAMDVTSPGFDAKFRRLRERTDPSLLSAARAYHEDATPLEAEFIKYGMSAGFLAELTTEIADFSHATSEHQNHTQTGVSVTANVDDAIQEGLSIRHRLNAIVRITLSDDSGLLAAWQSASHIEHPGRKPKAPPTPPSAETPGSSEEPKP